MFNIYVQTNNYEDEIVFYFSRESALRASFLYPNSQFDIYSIGSYGGYTPTYTYYWNR